MLLLLDTALCFCNPPPLPTPQSNKKKKNSPLLLPLSPQNLQSHLLTKSMAPSSHVVQMRIHTLHALLLISSSLVIHVAAATWCVARSDASDQALQTALDYACSAGADCAPLQSTGLCYLPNTLIAHASYAFDSYYQRKAMAPGSCSFAGTATIAKTDPSYGSCVYPSSPSAAGGPPTVGGMPTNPITSPSLSAPPPPETAPLSNGGGLTPGLGGGVPATQNSKAASLPSSTATTLTLSSFLLVLFLISEP